MVFDLANRVAKECLTAFLIAELKLEQLNAIQAAFGRGATAQNAELYIKDVPEYHTLSHVAIRKAEPSEKPILVIDKDTPSDGGIWYLAQFATEDEVEDGEAESEEVLWKIRIKIEDVPIMHANYDIGNQTIREDLDSLDVDYPALVDYTHAGLLTSGNSYNPDSPAEKWLPPTWVVLEPGEFEESTDEDVLFTLVPRQEIMYRIKPEIAREHGFKVRWMAGGSADPTEMPDGTTKTWPEGSITLQTDYDLERMDWGAYRKPEGSL